MGRGGPGRATALLEDRELVGTTAHPRRGKPRRISLPRLVWPFFPAEAGQRPGYSRNLCYPFYRSWAPPRTHADACLVGYSAASHLLHDLFHRRIREHLLC